MKFVADEMVGKLARWLRLAGYDTLYTIPISDQELTEIARRDGRTIVTRDHHFSRKTDPALMCVVDSENPFEQFLTVSVRFRLDIETHAFQRCLECNGALVKVRKERHRDKIPPRVYRTQKNFAKCLDCGRVYWPGTHYESMRRRLAVVKEALQDAGFSRDN